MKFTLLSCALAAAITAAPAFAASKSIIHHDGDFAIKAGQGGLAEVKLSELAEHSSTNAKVQEFAKQMVKDHSEANDKLDGVAQTNGIKLLKDLDPVEKATYAKLEKLSGEKFDREYAQAMLKDHKNAVALFQKESDTGRNKDLKQFAANTLPTLKSHLEMAQDLGKDVGLTETHHHHHHHGAKTVS